MNDYHINLLPVVQYEREERLMELARTRRQSVVRHASSNTAERFPSAEEAREAVLDARAYRYLTGTTAWKEKFGR